MPTRTRQRTFALADVFTAFLCSYFAFIPSAFRFHLTAFCHFFALFEAISAQTRLEWLYIITLIYKYIYIYGKILATTDPVATVT